MSAYTIAQIHTAMGGKHGGFREIDPTKKPGAGTLTLRSIIIDFDAIDTAAGTTGAANDTYQCIPMNPGELCIFAGINCITATTAACTYDLGVSSAASPKLDHWADGHDEAAGAKTSTDGYFSGGMYYTAADYIELKVLGNAPAGGKVQVWALVSKLNKAQSNLIA
ncbi:MAG: hypothetical protein ACXABY_08520 [Candidatus Thorarchaeota archaeon]|jgi:hypothetical protein